MARDTSPLSRRCFLKRLLGMTGAAVLGGCSSDRPTASTSDTTNIALPTPAKTTDRPTQESRFKGQRLHLMLIQPHVVMAEFLASDFAAFTGAKVDVTTVPYEQVYAKAVLDVQSGVNQFDIFGYWYPTIGALASQGIVEDLTDFIEHSPAIDAADFLPALYDTYTLHEGRRYGLPYDGDTHLLFYNREIFARNGVSAPTTWDDYLRTARTITEAEQQYGIYGCALLALPVPLIIGSSFTNRLIGFGGTFFDQTGTPQLNALAAQRAAKAMLDIAPYALPTPLETGFDQALPAFLSGQVAMMEFWSDLGIIAQDPKQSKIIGKWDVVPLPRTATT